MADPLEIASSKQPVGRHTLRPGVYVRVGAEVLPKLADVNPRVVEAQSYRRVIRLSHEEIEVGYERPQHQWNQRHLRHRPGDAPRDDTNEVVHQKGDESEERRQGA